MTGEILDKRVNAYRDDLAAAHLEGQVSARSFAEGSRRQIAAAAVALREFPRHDAVLETELLLGELVTVYDEREGWAWVQAARDSHVGYLSANALRDDIKEPTHRVRTLGTHIYPEPDYKAPPFDRLSMNALVSIDKIEGRFARLADGRYVVISHFAGIDDHESDFVAVAETFAGSPYLWGGRTNAGLDCSALVQLALHATGINCPRDSDLQEMALGTALPAPSGRDSLNRGDLIFWNGHVGILTDQAHLLHANVHHMAVVREPLADAIARIEGSYGPMNKIKRMD
ncbi:MAG: NlpC/P60 family protein [Pseudomonadota bacterium]